MAFNLSGIKSSLLEELNPLGKQGKVLLTLNALSMVLAAASNIFAIAKDKNTKQEDKKILIPAGVFTGIANIGAYYAMTTKIIKHFEDSAVKAVGGTIKEVVNGELVEKTIECPKEFKIEACAKNFAINKIALAKNGKFFGLFGKKSAEELGVMADTFLKAKDGGSVKELLKDTTANVKDVLKDAVPKEYAIETVRKNIKGGASVAGAFLGAIIGCSIITPIIRDIGAYIVQKQMEKKEPELKTKPYRPYFDPSHIGQYGYVKLKKQPLSMNTYMSFTNGSNMKI